MTLMLLDSASLWYRAYFGMPDTLLSPSGEPVNAIRGYLDMTARLMNIYKPNRIVACIEGDWRPSWRVELFPEYKANRLDIEGKEGKEGEEGEEGVEGEEVEPDTLGPQIPILLDLLEAFGIPLVGVDDYEADDVMASYAVKEKGPIKIVTGDRDLFQLVDDARKISVVYLAKGISNHDHVDLKWIADKYDIPGERYALFAMIRGDASDGLPGIRGIGEKGAAVIAKEFTNLEDVMIAARNSDERLTPNARKKLLESSDYARIAPKLVHCALDVPLPELDLQMPKRPKDLDEIYQYQKDYGLGASVDRLIAALEW